MKTNLTSLASIESEITHLKDLLSNAKVSVKEEKDIVSKISQLEAVMPYAI